MTGSYELRPAGSKSTHLSQDDIFKRIFLNEKVQFLIKIWLKFAEGLIDDKQVLVQIMACRLFGACMLTQFTDAYMRLWGEMS